MFRISESKRINILRAYFAVMVVFIHMYNAEIGSTGNVAFDGIEYILSRIVSGVAVPGFLLISSVLLYKKEFTWKDNVIKKIKRLVVPYLILNTFWVCFFAVVQQSPLQHWFSGERNNIVANWGLYDWFDAYFINPLLWPLWYLKSLFIFNVFAKVIKGAVDKFPKLSFLCILVLYFIFGGSVPVIRFDALFYFVMGYYIVKYDLHFRDLEKISKIYIALVYILLIALVYVTRGTAVHGAVDKLCIMTGLAFFAVVMTKVKNAGVEKLLLAVSRYSMGIYLFHEMNLTILRKIVQKVVPQNSITIFMEYFLIPCIIIVCCIILCRLLERWLPKVYGIVTGSR